MPRHSYPFDHAHDRPARELAAVLGDKGANLAELTTTLGLPVPPGFTITTATGRSFLESGWPAGLDEDIDLRLLELERRVGRRFGDPNNPLLVSVRSGAASTMPGMLDTVLNVGLTRAGRRGLSQRGDPAFAEDCYQRLLQGYRKVVGAQLPGDPRVQLRSAIQAVFRSWASPRALAYREREGLGRNGGTAVNVQAMVFGNAGPHSGAGVAFSRDPATGASRPVGDFLVQAQGEEVVGGRGGTMPLAALGDRFPAAHGQLLQDLAALEAHHRDACDVEFTIEHGRLWILQAGVAGRSAIAAVRMAVLMAASPIIRLSREEAVTRVRPERVAQALSQAAIAIGHVIAQGVGASPGVATGVACFTADQVLEAAARGTRGLLVRGEASPDDVRGVTVAEGILAARGGLVSHAVAAARSWGKPAVVGVERLHVADGSFTVGSHTVLRGDLVSIDGSMGSVLLGDAAQAVAVPSPELVTLLAWADAIAGAPQGSGVERAVARLQAAHDELARS